MHSTRITGIGIIIVGLVTFFGLIPFGIVKPSSIDTLALSPDFWPKIVAGIFTLMGIFLICQKPTTDDDSDDLMAGFVARLPRLIVVLAALFVFQYFIPLLGMVVPAMVLIFSMMWFAGERRWAAMFIISILTPVLLYLFFVNVASIPIPLGIFESLRG